MSETAHCPAHGSTYPWTLDCPECVKDARDRGMSIEHYYRTIRTDVRQQMQERAGGVAPSCQPVTGDGQ